MKKVNLYRLNLFLLWSAIMIVTACQKSEPAKLDFKDIFGREDWEVRSNYPEGFFYIERYNDMDVVKLAGSSPKSTKAVSEQLDSDSEDMIPDSYAIRLTGENPSLTSQMILSELPEEAYVLSIKYTSTVQLEASVTLNTTNGFTTSRLFSFEATAEEREYTFDLQLMREEIGWGNFASNFTIDFARNDGAEFTLKDIQVRARTTPEVQALDAFYINEYLPTRANVEYVTEYKTIGYTTVRLTPLSTPGDFLAMTPQIGQQIPKEYSKLTFTYKFELGNIPISNPAFHFWLAVVPPYGRAKIEGPNGLIADNEWHTITIDLNSTTGGLNSILNCSDYPGGYVNFMWSDPGKYLPLPRALRIEFPDQSKKAEAVYLRGLKLHK